jgi:cyclohexadieny/prephenate dehydrogenase / 3-phosphoshikimate 1-carboxyvinyltransferase
MTMAPVAVIGLGCIGGSLARVLAAHDGAPVRGWSASLEDRTLARDGGIDTSAASLEDAVRGASVIVLAVPLQAMADVAGAACRAADAEAVIVHCCGAQARATLGEDEATFARVFGAHPLAGSHDSGFRASRADLFDGCTVSIEARAPERVRVAMASLWQVAGAERLEYRAAAEHDALMAWVSHLPQLAATALAAALAAGRIDPQAAGPGARDSTRLAASAFDQWALLLHAAPSELDGALARLEQTIARIRAALSTGDSGALRAIWDSAREWRRDAEPGE